ncbi:hypothetical protein [Piscibacillus salipiscarius]|uniref:hypothetical protein n=1 Tax=Piscibacillus salipiscarius TaxID=299480 RepID=UPI0006D0B65C|nr:hypothetical protein [Piscibacillus salipiscarius]
MIRKILTWSIFALIFAVSTGAVILVYSIFQGPPEIKLDENTVLYDQDGQVLSVEHGVQTGFGWSSMMCLLT